MCQHSVRDTPYITLEILKELIRAGHEAQLPLPVSKIKEFDGFLVERAKHMAKLLQDD